MKYTFTRTYSRKNTDIDFYSESRELMNYMKTTYIDTNLCEAFREKRFLDNGELILEVKTVWLSKEAMEEGRIADLVVSDYQNNTKYNQEFGISLLSVIED